jgi:two-component system response regulator AtoC
MPTKPTTEVLIIDDDAVIRRTLSLVLAPTYSVHVASSGEEGISEYERLRPDVVLLDVMLPQMSGIGVLRALRKMTCDLPVIMMTAYAEVQTAVQSIKLGAIDYLQKPIDPAAVLAEIGRVVARASETQQSVRADIIGQSAALKRVRKAIERFGPTDIPILLQGETGTGKGLIADAIHRLSKRSQEPFVSIDCATIPADLAESELFGYEDGAFTGAGKRKRGRVSFADRGTLFVDEIGTLAVGTQAKLLTLFEQQQFLPLGARNLQFTRLDVRFISATNVSLQRAVEEGSFRADLYHRLNGITIELPPLRERDGDIALLARHFARTSAGQHGKPELDIAPEAMQLLQQYAWPGNIRELQRVLSVAAVVATNTVTADDLPQHIRSASASRDGAAARCAPMALDNLEAGGPDGVPINLREIKEWAGREVQKLVILELQKRTNMTRQELARMVGVDPKTLRARLKEPSGGAPPRVKAG